MTAPSLQGAFVDQHFSAGLPRGTRLAAAATATSGRAALAALTATEPAAAEMPAELDRFIDELAGIVHCPITGYQRELLQSALLGAIDARIGTLLGRLPA